VAKNEDGEFELILGNRQLLSVFFIVVILLGVFFTMGYIVGRNSAPVMSAEVASASKTQPPPLVVESPVPRPGAAEPAAKSEQPAGAAQPPDKGAPKLPDAGSPSDKSDAKQVAGTAPQQSPAKAAEPAKASPKAEAPKPEPAKPEPPKAKADSPKQIAKAEPPKPLPPSPAKPIPTPTKPVAGTYLQLAATNQREADIMVDVLRQKNFQAVSAEIAERPGLFRVLVGPLPADGEAKTRADLQSAGFPGNGALRRTF
jgi:hypothetical protein